MTRVLSVELVPRTAWWKNVRSNVTRAQWEQCKAYVKERSGSRCEICGGRGRRHPVECHEVWEYDDERRVQTLVDLIALCPDCHAVKHLGRTIGMGNGEHAIAHLMRVNRWTGNRAEAYCMHVLEIWRLRSQMEWRLDISFLERELGIKVKDPADSGAQ